MLAGPGRGELDLDVADVAVRPLLDDLRARFESRAVQEGRSVVVAGDGGIRINGDRLRLEQALTNLVENALRHGKGEVRLVSTRRDGVVELHVTDQGPGFPEDFMGSAFERFSKADPGRGQDGAGLGLSIVERIAEAHGGRAEAANHPDGGADVWIELPM
jgi:two-component system, OmpR family, sensor kinase